MPRTDDTIERIDKEGNPESLPSDYRTGKMQRGRKKRKGFTRRGRDGKEHYVESHYQRYWYGGKNFVQGIKGKNIAMIGGWWARTTIASGTKIIQGLIKFIGIRGILQDFYRGSRYIPGKPMQPVSTIRIINRQSQTFGSFGNIFN